MENLKYIPGDLIKIKNTTLNFVTNNIFKVISSLNGGILKVTMIDDDTIYSINNNCVIPIPITEELLLNNGWCSDDEGSYSISGYVDLELEQNGKKWYVIINHYFLAIEIQYVHELQHLMFSLGIDHYLKM